MVTTIIGNKYSISKEVTKRKKNLRARFRPVSGNSTVLTRQLLPYGTILMGFFVKYQLSCGAGAPVPLLVHPGLSVWQCSERSF
jgi:hypothetical protein